MKARTFLLLLLLPLPACTSHLIPSPADRAQIRADLARKQAALPHGALFSCLDQPSLSLQEREALSFLYAYMPIGDLTDYDPAFYLANIRTTLQARHEMPWGRSIPTPIFLHFVLPLRVNNEALDSFRLLYYPRLKERLSGLSLHDAILEVNHWCHEKAIYSPSDSRTSSPLATLRNASGRCGEESTFVVAALRSVGIPARQVYTPRWAHTDDNHAWVEAWLDGQWVFLGACEPEPVLNLGWFNAPAARAMLMHTKVFGRYRGQEEVMQQTPVYTEINITHHYAPTAQASVRVLDTAGVPVCGATVEFKVFNYAEFYPLASKTTDPQGLCSLSAGKGDLLLWATKDSLYAVAPLSFASETHKDLTLSHRLGTPLSLSLTLTPPPENNTTPPPPPPSPRASNTRDCGRQENDRRLLHEDSLRNAYVATFYNHERAHRLALELGIDPQLTATHLIAARGNHPEIEHFLRATPPLQRPLALSLLSLLSSKDLRDTPAPLLSSFLNYSPCRRDCGPRIANEMLTPYKTQLADSLSLFPPAPLALAQWVSNNIQVNDSLNPQRIPISPFGVLRARVADEHSRNIFFIAAARTLGIPARFDPVSHQVQCLDPHTDTWIDIHFESPPSPPSPPSPRSRHAQTTPATAGAQRIPATAGGGQLSLSFQPTPAIPEPKYHTHFTIARLCPDGRTHTLDLANSLSFAAPPTPLSSGSAPRASKTRDCGAGDYLLVTGSRLASGAVLAQLTFFHIAPNRTTHLPLVIRQSNDALTVIGEFNSESRYLAPDGSLRSILSTTGRGYFLLALVDPRQEPSNHALRDLAAIKSQLEQWGRPLLLLLPDQHALSALDTPSLSSVSPSSHSSHRDPPWIFYGIDPNAAIRHEILTAMKLPPNASLPIFILADTFNRVLFLSQGYSIGLGDRLLSLFPKL